MQRQLLAKVFLTEIIETVPTKIRLIVCFTQLIEKKSVTVGALETAKVVI